jgi:cytochrome b561
VTPSLKFQLYQLHKSIGITVLLLALLRLGWRLTHPAPLLPEDMPRSEKLVAHITHWLLYVLQIAVPMAGWALVSVSVLGIPTVLYGAVLWPHLPFLSSIENKAPVEALLATAHTWLAYAFICVVGAHIAAALRHHIIIRDDILTRIVPGLRPRAPKSGTDL